MSPKERKEYYAVAKGRIDEPTIFSSWGDTHPRVTGLTAPDFRGFDTIEKARNYLENLGINSYREIIKDGAGSTAPIMKSDAFYAIANGAKCGVVRYCGDNGCKTRVEDVSGNCHRHFRTQEQAEAFIEDWKQTVTELYSKEIKRALDRGFRPSDMTFSIDALLGKFEGNREATDEVDDLPLGKLQIGNGKE